MKVSLLALAVGLALSANIALAHADELGQSDQTALQPNAVQMQTASDPTAPDIDRPSASPYDPDRYLSPNGFPLPGWAQLKHPIN